MTPEHGSTREGAPLASYTPQLAGAQPVGPRNIVPLHTPPADDKGLTLGTPAAGAPAPAAPPPHLTYHGGPVLSAVQVVTVYWGAAWTQPAQAPLRGQVDAFFNFILTSSLIDQLAEYSLPGAPIGHGTHIGSRTITTSEPGGGSGTVSDGQIQAALAGWIAAGTVPAVTPNTLYFVYLPPGVVSTQGTQSSCVQYCGYHGHFNAPTGAVYYAVEPFVTCGGCSFGTILNTLTKVSSHELCEAITDPALNAWWDSATGNEIGDICNGSVTNLGGFTIQTEWSNSANACVLRPPRATLAARPRTPMSAVARVPTHLDVFAVANDGRTMSDWWDASFGWANWFQVEGGVASPGGAGSPVTSVSRFANHLDLFTVGTDNRVYSCWWDASSGWHPWFPLGTMACRPGSTVNVVSRNINHLDLFTTAADGATVSTWWDASTGWAGWFQVMGGVAAPGATVTAVARFPTHLDLFTVGTDERVYSCWWDAASGWHAWFPLNGVVCRPDSVVNAVVRFVDHLDLFTTAANGATMSTWWDVHTGWAAGWFQVSGGVASPGAQVTAVSRFTNHLDVFTIGTDNRVYSTWWDAATGWAGWFWVAGGVGEPGGTVAAISRLTAHLDLFTVGSDGLVYATSWDGSSGWASWFTA